MVVVSSGGMIAHTQKPSLPTPSMSISVETRQNHDVPCLLLLPIYHSFYPNNNPTFAVHTALHSPASTESLPLLRNRVTSFPTPLLGSLSTVSSVYALST